jgi:hypothetical protein
VKAWFQFLAVYDCKKCGWSKGRIWEKNGVWLTVDPCEKHARMLVTQGWVEQ